MRLLHLDIESAPNLVHVWGLYNVNVGIKQVMAAGYILCWAAKWHNKRDIYFGSLHHESNYEMLEKLWYLLDEADTIVAYNGDKYDIPTIKKEFLLEDMTPPSPYAQIDLYKVVRQQFRFPSKKLDYVANALGLGTKVKHEGHELWIGCMEDDPKSWAKMERYNKMDVRLLERLYKKLLPWIKAHPNYGMFVDRRPVCTNCGSIHVQSRGMQKNRTQEYRRFQCSACGTWMRSRTSEKTRDNLLVQT